MRKSCMSDERSRNATLMKTGYMIISRSLLPHIRLDYADGTYLVPANLPAGLCFFTFAYGNERQTVKIIVK